MFAFLTQIHNKYCLAKRYVRENQEAVKQHRIVMERLMELKQEKFVKAAFCWRYIRVVVASKQPSFIQIFSGHF